MTVHICHDCGEPQNENHNCWGYELQCIECGFALNLDESDEKSDFWSSPECMDCLDKRGRLTVWLGQEVGYL